MPELKAVGLRVLALWLITTGAVCAQSLPDAGSLLRQQLKTAPKLPERKPPSIHSDQLAPSSATRDSGTTWFDLKAIRISGNTVFSEAELLEPVQELIGEPVGLADLDEITARISHFYRSRGYPVARAYLPPQEIVDGAVQIVVVEGSVGVVRIYDGSRVRTTKVRRHLRELPGSVISAPELERTLLLLDDLSGVGSVHATLSPGALSGESDIAVDLDREPFVAGSLEGDNHGNRYVGANQLTAKLEMNSPLRIGDELAAQFTRSDGDMELKRLSYLLPVGIDGVELGATYIGTEYGLGKQFAVLDASGDSDSYTFSASYPLIRSGDFSLYARAIQSWRAFEDRTFGTQLVEEKSSDVTTLMVNGNSYDTLWGGGGMAFALAYTAGQLDIETPVSRSIDAVTARTYGQFDKWNLQLLRVQSFGLRTSVYVALTGQQAGGNLDSSEKFILGGANGVRAYPQGEAVGDSGYIATAELRYLFLAESLLGTLQTFLFVDSGAITVSEEPFVSGDNHRELSGCGIGMAWSSPDDLTVKMTLARRLGNEPVQSDKDQLSQFWLQASLPF